MLGHRELSPHDYLDILRRRRWLIIVPAVLGPAIACGIALLLPNRYTSRTLVLVEEQKVPDAYVQPVVTQDLSLRLGTMQEQIFSRTRLQPIIERFGLYPGSGAPIPVEDAVAKMRKDIQVTPVRSVGGNRQGIPGFTISFTAGDPQLAQRVCTQITSMFIEENLRQRQQSSQDTTNFIETQLRDAKSRLDAQDEKLARFKVRHMGDLPDETQRNLNMLGSLNTQLEAVALALNRAQQDKAYSNSLLSQQLATWEAQQSTPSVSPETREMEIARLRKQLTTLESRYTAAHPEVIQLKTEIAELEKKTRETSSVDKSESRGPAEEAGLIEPPQIQQLRSQLHADDLAIQNYAREQERLLEQINQYESRIQLSPLIEQEYKELTRDHETALAFYNDLLRKKQQSTMATDLERRQQGEQFLVMDPANLPEKPSFPNRPLFAGVGFAGGLVLGLLWALLLEMVDRSLRTDRDIEFFLGLPTLAMIPSIGKAAGRFAEERSKKGIVQAG